MAGAFTAFRLRTNAIPKTAVVCEVSGVLGAGENGFGTIATIAAGFSGPTPSIDTSVFIPPNGSEEDTCFICKGAFQNGEIVVEGSIDNAEWNPIGGFQVARLPEGAPTISELSPLLVRAITRYVRLNVKAVILGPVTVTMGGRVPATGGSGGTTSLEFGSSEGRVTTPNAPDAEILYQEPVNLSELSAPTLTATLSGVIASTGGTKATFNAYLGSTTPGTVGTLVASISTNSNLIQVLVTAAGAPFANPGGVTLLQITGANDGAGASMIFSFNLALS